METIKLDLIPGKKMPSLHASQYDDGREHGIDLFDNGVVYKLDGTETLTINERKGDDYICSLDIENTFADTNHIEFASTEQMCAVWGNNICELVIAKGEKTIGTLNFILEVEPSPTEGGIESESEIKNLTRQIEAITEEVIGDDYYTKTQTDNLLNAKANVSSVYTKAEVDTKLNAKANTSEVYTRSQVDNKLADKADVSDLPDMSQYYDKGEVDDLLDDKANSDDVYGKAYIDTALSGKANVGTSYTKSEEDALLDDKADADNTYTKAQVDDIVYNILPDDTASGSVANFETDLALPIKSLEIDVNAVQDLHGYDHPWVGGAGVNQWNEDYALGFWNVYGEFSANTQGYMSNKTHIPVRPNTQYRFVEKNTNYSFYICFYTEDKTFIRRDTLAYSEATTVITTPSNCYFVCFSTFQQYGTTYNHDISLNYPHTVTTYAPYENICPISGWDAITPNVNGTTEVINLGGTYYGGHFTQDKAGHRQFVATHEYETNMGQYNYAYVSASNCFRTTNFNKAYKRTAYTIIANSLCSHYGGAKLQEVLNQSANNSTYAFGIVGLYNGSVLFRNTNYSDATAFKSSMQGVTMTFELETPIIIDLPDGEPIITLNGTNNIFADTGDTSVVFKDSVNGYVEKKIASVQALALNT